VENIEYRIVHSKFEQLVVMLEVSVIIHVTFISYPTCNFVIKLFLLLRGLEL